MYTLRHHAYCGMSDVPETFDTRADARGAAARELRRFRRRFRVVTLRRSSEWEILEPEGSLMVPDACGTLTLRHVTYKCRNCDCIHESRESAYVCCGE